MKKLIFFGIVIVIIPSMILLSVALIYLLYGGERVNGTDLVDYLAVSITVSVAIIIIAAVTANYIAAWLTGKIVNSLRIMDENDDGIALYDELMQYAVNLNHQKQTLRDRIEDLTNRTDTVETITGNMQEGLVLINGTGLILSANNSAHRIFGENIERKNVIHVCREDFFQRAVKQCLSGENAEIQMNWDGKIYSVFFSPVPANMTNGNSNKTTRGAVILFHDTTERYRAEQQRREFSANVSHELKTPLTTISALAEMITQGMAKEDDIKTFGGRITEQSGRLLLLIDDIIRLSEFDENHVERENTGFDLWELTETVINSLKDNANTGKVELILTGERFDVSANIRMIDELLYNLIDNGIKYNREGGNVTIELTKVKDKGTVPLSSGDSDNFCQIIVSDTGIGIAQEHHNRIFERFYRADKSRSKKTGGTGLGLSIVKHITEYYNGNLELNSKPGFGTTITCLLNI